MRKAGLRPVGIDLSAFGMIRALGNGSARSRSEGEHRPDRRLYCHLGDITNLAVARGAQCLFTRIAPFGIENIAARVAEQDLDAARRGARVAGRGRPRGPTGPFDDDRDRAEAAREALEDGASKLVDELRVSLEFYGAQEGAPAIERVVVCGPGSTIPGLPERLQGGLGLGIEPLSPPALGQLDAEDAARLTVSYGLALDG